MFARNKRAAVTSDLENPVGTATNAPKGGRVPAKQHYQGAVIVLFLIFGFATLIPGPERSSVVKVAATNCEKTELRVRDTTGKCLELQNSKNETDRWTPVPEQKDLCLEYTIPSIYIKTVMTSVVGTPIQGRCAGGPGGCSNIKPYKEKLRKYGNDWPPFGLTMVGKVRMEQFRASIEEVDRNNIPGAIIELGVWRGGNMMMAAAVVKEAKSNRDLYIYDAFESIPGYGGISNYLENSMADVQANFAMYDLLDPNVHFVKGLFKDTVPHWKKGTPIAVLRVDGNFYDSYSDALYAMYEDVPVGGIVIFDDVMSHAPVMRCWKDFKADHGLPEELNRIDLHSAWFRKKVATKIDQAKRHEPQDVNVVKKNDESENSGPK